MEVETDLSQCRLLLVDDVRENINVLIGALKDDYRLGFALNGEAALKFARQKHPDLILLDVMMPGMDGFEVCRRLKADPVTRDIPVLFLTALDEVEHKRLGFETGAVDYVIKPFEVVEVKARVRTHLTLRLAHQALARQRDRLKHSLDLAMEVQQNLIPSSDPVIKGLDVAGRISYCDETGGDYYDYLHFGPQWPGCLTVAVGDVSEHGIPSALLMTTARALLRQCHERFETLAEVADNTNVQFSRDVEESGRFMTLFLCRVDAEAGELKWVRAGPRSGPVVRPGNRRL